MTQKKCICICHAIGIRNHYCYLYAVRHKAVRKGKDKHGINNKVMNIEMFESILKEG